jgi:hypothetical protein
MNQEGSSSLFNKLRNPDHRLVHRKIFVILREIITEIQIDRFFLKVILRFALNLFYI